MDINNNSLLGTLKIMLLKGERGEKGEAGTSGDYSGLINKPKINNVTVDGNMSGTDLGLPTIAQMVSAIYPVGSVYISVNDNDPSVLFGGTWMRIKDTFLLASGDTYANGSTGGSADAVVVEHQHSESASAVRTSTKSNYRLLLKSNATTSDASIALADNDPNIFDYDLKTLSTGVDGAGKNMPPYLAVYMWKRTA